MSRTTVWIPRFGFTLNPLVLLCPSSFHELSQLGPSSEFDHSYQNILRIVIWLFFLVVYSQAGVPFLWFSQIVLNYSNSPRTSRPTGPLVLSPRVMGDYSICYDSGVYIRRCVNPSP